MVTLTEVALSIDLEVLEKPVVLCKHGHDKVFKTLTSFKRTSGTRDEILLNFPDTVSVSMDKGDFIHVEGELRSGKDGSAVYIFAKNIQVLSEEPEKYENLVEVHNAELYSLDKLRRSSDGSTDLLSCKFDFIRRHSRHAYIGAVCWGSDAVFLANTGIIREKYHFKGRLQRHVSSNGRGYTEISIWYLDVEPKNEESTS